jgi:hypothetical protein
MRLRAFEKLMEAIEARKTGEKIFTAPNANWIFAKQRPTQFNSSKNFPKPGKYWEEKENIGEPSSTA